MKTLAIRLHDEQHARLHLLAKVTGETVTDLIRSAIDERLDALVSDKNLAAKAKTVLEELERQAQAERDAITGLLNGNSPVAKPSRTTSKKAEG